MNLSMILILSSVLSLSVIGSVNVASGQVIDTIRVLQGGSNGQCSSLEERERERSDIHQIAIQSAENQFTCNGTPGWRCVALST